MTGGLTSVQRANWALLKPRKYALLDAHAACTYKLHECIGTAAPTSPGSWRHGKCDRMVAGGSAKRSSRLFRPMKPTMPVFVALEREPSLRSNAEHLTWTTVSTSHRLFEGSKLVTCDGLPPFAQQLAMAHLAMRGKGTKKGWVYLKDIVYIPRVGTTSRYFW